MDMVVLGRDRDSKGWVRVCGVVEEFDKRIRDVNKRSGDVKLPVLSTFSRKDVSSLNGNEFSSNKTWQDK